MVSETNTLNGQISYEFNTSIQILLLTGIEYGTSQQ